MKNWYKLPLLLLAFSMYLSCSQAQTYCTPSYKGPGIGGTGKPSSFFTHILEVQVGDLVNIVPAPTVSPSPNYDDFSYLSTDFLRNFSYPLSVKVGNGANQQHVTVWVDWNQNGVFESNEIVLNKFDPANTGTHVVSTTLKVPANAAIGKTRMRIATIFDGTGTHFADPCNNNTGNDMFQHFHDYTVNVLSPAVQTYQSSTTSHPNFDEVVPGSTNNMIMQIIVETNTDGALSPVSANGFKFSLLGSTNPADITLAKLFYTGKDRNFSSSTQVGAAMSSPSTYFTINANQKLQPGKNYFWLTYDINSTALSGNVVDARLNTIDVGGERAPDITSPSGAKNVGYCVSKGTKNNFVYIYSVSFGSFANYSFVNPDGYGNYTKLSTTAYKRKGYPISIQAGNGVNANFTRGWIDYNQDGDFNDAGELVLFDSINSSLTNFTFGPMRDTIFIPASAKVGPTRMRLITSYKPQTGYIPTQPCTNPVEIGEVEDYTVNIADTGAAVASFKSSISCAGNATVFKDSSYSFGGYNIKSWLWKFGDGDSSTLQNPTHTYANPGVYYATLTVKSSYPATSATLTKVVMVNKPVPDFTSFGSVYKTPVLFSDQTTGGVVTSWYWSFGDPASGVDDTSTLDAPIHSFDTAGTYFVKLVVTTEGGCVDSITKKIVIVQAIKPVANFSASTFLPYLSAQVNLKDLSTNRPTAWKWTFAPTSVTFYNGTSFSSQNPVVSFDALTTYKVTLEATNSAGTDTISRFFVVQSYKAPVADFTANRTLVKAGQLVSFLDLSKNDPITWNWKFGNNDSSYVQHPIYKYRNIGTYTVKLDVSNPAGKSSKTQSNYITVIDKYKMCETDAPFSGLYSGNIADDGDSDVYSNNTSCGFLIRPDCAGPITLVFDSFSMAPNDYIRVYDGIDNSGRPLHSGLGFTGASLPRSIVADSSGAMYIEQVSDFGTFSDGFRASWFAVPNIKPKADFIMDTVGYINSPMTLRNNTKLGINNTYVWDYNNDGVYDDSSKDGHFTFKTLGTFKVKMLAYNCKGKDSITKTIRIINPTVVPVADFYTLADTVVLYDSVQLFDNSKFGPTAWKWSFSPNNGSYYNSTAASQNPIIFFNAPGAYDISLQATNGVGTSPVTTKRRFIYVKDQQDLCNSTISTEPYGRLNDAGGKLGNYPDNSNCDIVISTCAEELILRFNYIEIAPNDFLRIYDGVDNSGKALFSGAGLSGFSNGQIFTFVSKSGSFYIQQLNSNDGQVARGFDADWFIKPWPKPIASFTGPDTVYTGGSPARFTATTKGVVDKYNWDFNGDGTTDDTLKNAVYNYTTAGTYKLRLVVSHCTMSDTIFKTIIVLKTTAAPKIFFSADMLNASTLDTVRFMDRSKNGPTSWTWSISPASYVFTNGTNANTQDPRVNFTAPGQYTVKLVASNSLGSDSLTKTSYINVFTYCVPTIQSTGSDVGISKVVVGTINNITLFSPFGYTDYTSSYSTNLDVGAKYGITIDRKKALNTATRRAWIDYNQDGDFDDAGEMLVEEKNALTLSFTDSFKVPTTALTGPTRLRVGVGEGTDPDLPCSSNTLGEYEDYRVIIGKDQTPPVITMRGISPVQIEVGSSYTDAGADAIDVIDGNLTSKIVKTGSVDTSKVGNYFIRYNVSDAAGNPALEVVRTVQVTADKTPPVLTLKGPDPEKIQVFNNYIEYGATAIDNRDGNVSNNIGIDTSEVDTFRLGTYKVYYTAFDNSKNFSQQLVRTVIVFDSVRPVISLNGRDTVRLKIGDTWTDSATVKDNYDATVKLNKAGTPNFSKKGTYTIVYSAKDASNNSAQPKVRVVIVDDGLAIDDYASGLNFLNIYPVPAKEAFTVRLALNEAMPVKIELLNALGQVVSGQDCGIRNYGEFTFDTKEMNAGIYFLRISSSGGNVVRKVQVVK